MKAILFPSCSSSGRGLSVVAVSEVADGRRSVVVNSKVVGVQHVDADDERIEVEMNDLGCLGLVGLWGNSHERNEEPRIYATQPRRGALGFGHVNEVHGDMVPGRIIAPANLDRAPGEIFGIQHWKVLEKIPA